MERIRSIPIAAAALLVVACAAGGSRHEIDDDTAVEAGVLALLDEQQQAWNAGLLDEFLDGYAPREDLLFVSGTNVIRGFTALRERYRSRYGGPGGMGALSFDDLQVRPLAADAALVTGHWRVVNDRGPSEGRFTLLLRLLDARWRITVDHTS